MFDSAVEAAAMPGIGRISPRMSVQPPNRASNVKLNGPALLVLESPARSCI
jgi:hypothetical protein